MAGERGNRSLRAATRPLLKEYASGSARARQYGSTSARVLHVDLGKSMIHAGAGDERNILSLFPGHHLARAVRDRVPLVIGIAAGCWLRVRRNSVFDHGVMGSVAGRLFDPDLLSGG